MIGSAMLGVLFGVVGGVVSIFPPAGEVPGQIVSGLNTLVASASALNSVLPIAEMFVALGIYLNAYILLVVVSLALKIYHQVWGSD